MARELLNYYLDEEGLWQTGQLDYRKSGRSIPVNAATLRIHETSLSGVGLLSPVGVSLTSCGDAEVYLKIIHTDGTFEYLSAPVRTPVDFKWVRELELNILYLVGNPACSSIRYRAFFNAHCIYERILRAGVPVRGGSTRSKAVAKAKPRRK